MSPHQTGSGSSSPARDRSRLGRALFVIGIGGLVASGVVGVAGWVLADRAGAGVSQATEPISAIVVNVSESIDASQVIFERLIETVESIETATRSTVRTLTSVEEVLGETADLASGGIADSLDSAVDTLPGLISTGRVVDGTMRALSLVGVDYDPAVPLDVALSDLETSLAPIPGQIRDQVALLETVQSGLADIADDARGLSAVLLETRIEMLEAESVLASAAANAAAAVESVEAIESEIATYGTLAHVVVVAAALALAAGSLAPLLLGLHLRRE